VLLCLILTYFPFPPLLVDSITVPLAVAKIGVPISAAKSVPKCGLFLYP